MTGRQHGGKAQPWRAPQTRPAQQEQAAGDDEDDEGQLEDQHGNGQQPVDHCSTLLSLTLAASRCTRSIRRFLELCFIMGVSGAWRSVYPHGHPLSRQRRLSTRSRDLLARSSGRSRSAAVAWMVDFQSLVRRRLAEGTNP